MPKQHTRSHTRRGSTDSDRRPEHAAMRSLAREVNVELPDFFILGAPKCGTTTLYDWLAAHPRIVMPGKEICFFSQDIFPTEDLPHHIPDLEAYARLFAVPPGTAMLKGDATPKYLHSDRALAAIAKLLPEARLVVCLRDPVDLAVSLHRQKLAEGWEPEADFAAAWNRELNFSTAEDARNRPGDLNYVFWAHLGRRLERLYGLFRPEQILILHLMDLRRAPQRTYERVLAFIGVEYDGRTTFSASNVGRNLRSPRVHRFALAVYRLAEPMMAPLRRMRSGRGFGLLGAVTALNSSRAHNHNRIDASLRAQMYDYLSADMALAEAFSSRSLRTGVLITDNAADCTH